MLTNGSSPHSSRIDPLASGESKTVPFYSFNADEEGDFIVEVVADYTDVIEESDESNNTRSDTITVANIFGLPDLLVTDISWIPEQPMEGETVTFTAEVQNQGYGGGTTNYDVRFTIDGTDVIGTTTVTDHIGLGQMDKAFVNSGFELGTWEGWSTYNSFTLQAKTGSHDSVFASAISGGTLQSEPFTVTDSVISCYVKSGYGSNSIRIYTSDGNLIASNLPYPEDVWLYRTFNVSEYIGQEVYFYARAWSGYDLSIDNISMGKNPTQRVQVALPSAAWQASPGEHTIQAEVDVNNVIEEAGEENNSLIKSNGGNDN
jgi:hypothetical protein